MSASLGSARERIVVQQLSADATAALAIFDASKARCFLATDRQRMLAIIEVSRCRSERHTDPGVCVCVFSLTGGVWRPAALQQGGPRDPDQRCLCASRKSGPLGALDVVLDAILQVSRRARARGDADCGRRARGDAGRRDGVSTMLHGNGQVPCTTASRACGGGGGEDLLIPFSLLSKSYCSDFCCPVRHAVGALKFGLLVVHSRSLMPYQHRAHMARQGANVRIE